jgi:hypothetical protein
MDSGYIIVDWSVDASAGRHHQKEARQWPSAVGSFNGCWTV